MFKKHLAGRLDFQKLVHFLRRVTSLTLMLALLLPDVAKAMPGGSDDEDDKGKQRRARLVSKAEKKGRKGKGPHSQSLGSSPNSLTDQRSTNTSTSLAQAVSVTSMMGRSYPELVFVPPAQIQYSSQRLNLALPSSEPAEQQGENNSQTGAPNAGLLANSFEHIDGSPDKPSLVARNGSEGSSPESSSNNTPHSTPTKPASLSSSPTNTGNIAGQQQLILEASKVLSLSREGNKVQGRGEVPIDADSAIQVSEEEDHTDSRDNNAKRASQKLSHSRDQGKESHSQGKLSTAALALEDWATETHDKSSDGAMKSSSSEHPNGFLTGLKTWFDTTKLGAWVTRKLKKFESKQSKAGYQLIDEEDEEDAADPLLGSKRTQIVSNESHSDNSAGHSSSSDNDSPENSGSPRRLDQDDEDGKFSARSSYSEEQRVQREAILRFLGIPIKNGGTESPPRSPFLSARSINGDSENPQEWRSPLNPQSQADGSSVDEESQKSKKNFAQALLGKLLNKNAEKAIEYFEELITSHADTKGLVFGWVLDLAKKHASLLGEDFVKGFEELGESYPSVKNLTFQDWTEIFGFSLSPKAFKRDKERKNNNKAFRQEEFIESVRTIIAHEIASRILMEKMERKDPKFKGFLDYLQQYVTERNLTRWQWAAGLFGLAIAAGAAVANGTIYTTSFETVDPYYFASGANYVEGIVQYSATGVTLLVSAPSDCQVCAKIAGPSKAKFAKALTHFQRFKTFIKQGCAQGSAFALTLLTFFYFYDYTIQGIEWLDENPTYPNQQKLKEETWVYFYSLVWALVLDGQIGNGLQLDATVKSARKKITSMYSWFEKKCFPNAHNLKKVPLSPEEIERRDVISILKNLKSVVFHMTDEDIKNLFNQIYIPLFKGKSKKGNETLNATDAFITLSWFLKYLEKQMDEEEVPEPQKCMPKSWKKKFAVGLSVFASSCASVAAYLAFQYIMSAFTDNEYAQDAAGFFGLSVRLFMDELASEQNIKGMLVNDVSSETSHPYIRKTFNVVSGVVGTLMTFPYAILIWLIANANGYSTAEQAALITTGVIMDAHSNSWFTNQTANSYIIYYDRLKYFLFGERLGRLSSVSKRDELIRWIDSLIDLVRVADPQIIVKLVRKLDKKNSMSDGKHGEQNEK